MTADYVFVASGELRVDDQVCSPFGMNVFVTSTPRPMSSGGFSVECELIMHIYPGEAVKILRRPAPTVDRTSDPVDSDDLLGVEVPY